MTVIQRFGGGLNLNVHFHTLVLDGVFTEGEEGALHFRPLTDKGLSTYPVHSASPDLQQQTEYDPECDLHSILHRFSSLEPADSRQGFLVCVVFVIERDGEVLLLKRGRSKDHAPGEWETGSGGILSGEVPVAAVLREAKEETGLDVEVGGPIDAFHFYRGAERRETIGITFNCRARSGAVTLSEEHEESKWVPLDAVADGAYPAWLRRAAALVQTRR